MEKEDIIELTQQLYGSYFSQITDRKYLSNLVDLDVNMEEHDGWYDMDDFVNYFTEIRKEDKVRKENKDYTNGVPKDWDDEKL
jgi:hypothetical protein